MTTAYITHPICLQHEMGSGHPECPARIRVIEQYLQDHGLMSSLQQRWKAVSSACAGTLRFFACSGAGRMMKICECIQLWVCARSQNIGTYAA
jgi:hypothetical protein